MKETIAREELCRHVTDNSDRLYRLAFSYVKNEENAMDIVQEVACKLLKNAYKLERPEYIDTWLYRVTVNTALDFLRKHKREVIGLPLVEESRPDSHEQIYLMDVLDHLDDSGRAILILHYFEDKPLAEVAEILDIPLSTVKTRMYKALKMLRTQFYDEEEQGNA